MTDIIKAIGKASLTAICAQHVTWFERLIERAKAGERGVRQDECEVYLATWLGGQAALRADQPLPSDVINEIEDALCSGEVDSCLTDEEREKVRGWCDEVEEPETKTEPNASQEPLDELSLDDKRTIGAAAKLGIAMLKQGIPAEELIVLFGLAGYALRRAALFNISAPLQPASARAVDADLLSRADARLARLLEVAQRRDPEVAKAAAAVFGVEVEKPS